MRQPSNPLSIMVVVLVSVLVGVALAHWLFSTTAETRTHLLMISWWRIAAIGIGGGMVLGVAIGGIERYRRRNDHTLGGSSQSRRAEPHTRLGRRRSRALNDPQRRPERPGLR